MLQLNKSGSNIAKLKSVNFSVTTSTGTQYLQFPAKPTSGVGSGAEWDGITGYQTAVQDGYRQILWTFDNTTPTSPFTFTPPSPGANPPDQTLGSLPAGVNFPVGFAGFD